MKNFCIVILILIFMGDNVFGMNRLSDNELSGVYAKSGINIVIDDVTIAQRFGSLSYNDLDGGLNPYNLPTLDIISNSKGAKISLNNFKFDVLHINQLLPNDTAGEIDAHFNTSMSEIIQSFDASGLTIDVVDELPILSIGYNYMFGAKYGLPLPEPGSETYNKCGIVFGVPTLDIFADEIQVEQITIDNLERNSINNKESFFSLNIKNMDIALFGGYFEITSHQECGLDIALDDNVIYMNFDRISISDPEGTKENNFSDGGTSLSLGNVTIDTLKLNALTHTDFSILNLLLGNIHIQSPGTYNAHLQNLDNYKMVVLLDILKSYHAQPLLINVTRQLPGITELYKSAGIQGSFAGIFVAAPTVEIYMDNFKIDKITINDSSNIAANNGASFFGTNIKGIEIAELAGYVEICPQ